jgi:hypothetical protein
MMQLVSFCLFEPRSLALVQIKVRLPPPRESREMSICSAGGGEQSSE